MNVALIQWCCIVGGYSRIDWSFWRRASAYGVVICYFDCVWKFECQRISARPPHTIDIPIIMLRHR